MGGAQIASSRMVRATSSSVEEISHWRLTSIWLAFRSSGVCHVKHSSLVLHIGHFFYRPGQGFTFVVGVTGMHFRRVVADDASADLFRNVGIGQRGGETVPKRVEAAGVLCPLSTLGPLAQGATVNLRMIHNGDELRRKPVPTSNWRFELGREDRVILSGVSCPSFQKGNKAGV